MSNRIGKSVNKKKIHTSSMSSAIIAQIPKVPPPAVEVYAEDTQQREINDGGR
jgi:hypothetical protein